MRSGSAFGWPLLVVMVGGLSHAGPSTATAAESLPAPAGRRLSILIDTRGIPGPPAYFRRANGALRFPRAYATSAGLVIDLYAEPLQPRKDDYPFVRYPARLLIRLFDQKGQPLSEFLTTEYFCTDAEMLAWGKRHAADGRFVPILLKREGNRFTYPVNQHDLDYTASVEVGFTVPGT